MKPKFTMLQKILTTLFVVLVGAVITADVLKLFVFENQGNTYYNSVNLVLCVLLLLVFLALIFNPRAGTNAETDDAPETLAPQLSASRTYMCFIAVDIALIFTFVMYFAKHFEKPAIIVIVGGIAIFVIGAIKYISDCKKIGFEEIEYEDDDVQEDKQEGKSQEASEVPAEAKTETVAEPVAEKAEETKTEQAPVTEETKSEAKAEEKAEPKTEESKDNKAEKPEKAEKPQQKPSAPKPAPKNNPQPKKNYPAKKNSGKGKNSGNKKKKKK